MKAYELLFFVDPSLDPETRLAVMKRIDTTIAEGAGKVDSVDEWGKRKLAYEINYLTEGYYVLVKFTSGPELPAELDRILGITDGVIIRHDDETVGQSVLADTLRDYGDIDLIFVDGERARALEATDTVQSMPCWPAVGSVAVIDDTVVVKLSGDLHPAN